MAKFNYKKWVTENKYGIQPTMDGVDDSGSYRYYVLPKDAYAVEIKTNINYGSR